MKSCLVVFLIVALTAWIGYEISPTYLCGWLASFIASWILHEVYPREF